MVVDIADRLGRSLENYERNPYYYQTGTISGVIEFLCAKPMARKA